jgi:[CysO sulfur-carrier protein]-S-L-cysteine hydrolase
MTGLECCPAEPALEIPEDILSLMIAHCLRESPLECCGLLGGVPPRVTSFHPLRNVAGSETRYTADTRELVEAWRWLREHSSQILAIYHSHPRWQPVPSATDLKENYWGDTPRIIVGLLTDPPEVRVWRLETSSYTELPWVLKM